MMMSARASWSFILISSRTARSSCASTDRARPRNVNQEPDLGDLLRGLLTTCQTHIQHIVNSALPCATALMRIADFQATVCLSRPARHEALDLRITIFRPEHRAMPTRESPI